MAKPHIFLIHGAWHWGGCFQKVADLLAAAGFPVVTPDLKSHGYSDASWQDVTSMADYTQSVSELLSKTDAPVVLVGHSMGGVTISYLAETMPEKIKCLVYLTAFMTPVGKTANDYIFSYVDHPAATSLFTVLKPVDGGVRIDQENPEGIRDAFYGDCSPTDVGIAFKNVAGTNTSVPNIYAPTSLSTLPRHYITCSQDRAIPLDIQQRMIGDTPGATVHEMGTSHSPFFSAPRELAAILQQIAAD